MALCQQTFVLDMSVLQPFTLAELPEEIVLRIGCLSKSAQTILRLSGCSSYFYRLMQSDGIWETLCGLVPWIPYEPLGAKESYHWYTLCHRVLLIPYETLGPKESYSWYQKGVYLHRPVRPAKKTTYAVYRKAMTGKLGSKYGWDKANVIAHWHKIKKTDSVRPYQRLADAYNEHYGLK